ncbi:MAG: DUF1579 domain-containing protein [Candidatus Eiseniibacteriota bacterium]
MHARFRSPVHRLVPFLCLALFVANTGMAADTPKAATGAPKVAADASKAQQDAAMAEMMKLSAPGPMHALLKPLEGKWKASIKSWMGPTPTISEGTCERTWIMGGRYLQSKHSGDMMGMPFEGMEILTYDNMKKQFTSVWMDNMAPMLTLATDGQADATGKIITMNSLMPDPATGNMVPFKDTYKIVDNDHYMFTISGMKDGKEYAMMEISYTRVQ